MSTTYEGFPDPIARVYPDPTVVTEPPPRTRRFFDRRVPTWVFVIVVIVAVAGLTFTGLQWRSEASHSSDLQHDLSETTASLQDVKSELRSVRTDLTDVREQVADTKRDLDAARADIDEWRSAWVTEFAAGMQSDPELEITEAQARCTGNKIVRELSPAQLMHAGVNEPTPAELQVMTSALISCVPASTFSA